jgi:NTP pyrophosphatase (non-canonical NTP hydrolase)
MMDIVTDLRVLMDKAHRTARDKGWWDDDRSFGDQFANFHAEISEAWEEYRSGHRLDEIYYSDTPQGPKPEGMAAELADVLIRIFDTCEFYDIPLIQAINEKMFYNTRRPYRHGNKRA